MEYDDPDERAAVAQWFLAHRDALSERELVKIALGADLTTKRGGITRTVVTGMAIGELRSRRREWNAAT